METNLWNQLMELVCVCSLPIGSIGPTDMLDFDEKQNSSIPLNFVQIFKSIFEEKEEEEAKK